MRKFKRHGVVISSHLAPEEVMLLQTLLAQLIEMITEAEPAAPPESPGAARAETSGQPSGSANENDPFALWAEELADDAEAKPSDPALQRLFPDAYRDDPDAAADFRRFTQRDLRAKKVDDAEVALGHLALTEEGHQELRIPVPEAESWLRVLTSLRLTVASRLGIDDAAVAEELAELPDDDPRAYMASVYDWLGFAQETLIEAL